MNTLKITELTLENFKPFGSYEQLINPTAIGGGIPGMAFYPDLVSLELNFQNPSFSTTRVEKKFGKTIVAIEQHDKCGEGILSLDGDMIVYFAPASSKYPEVLNDLKAFYVPKGTMLCIHPGVWHCMPFAANTDVINVLNVLPRRTYKNDVSMQMLKEEERITIVD